MLRTINWDSPVTKLVLVVASLGFWCWYFSLFDKGFTPDVFYAGLSLMTCLLVHEYGHMWALKRLNINYRGPYVTPMGAIIFPQGQIPTLAHEFFMAIMGPVAGFLLAVVTMGLFILTQHQFFAYATVFGAIINFFNLFPINPLDGGRVAKAISFSISPKVGLGVYIFGMVFLAYLTMTTLNPLFLIIFVMGFGETIGYVKYYRIITNIVPPMQKKEIIPALFFYFLLFGILGVLLYLSGGSTWIKTIFGI